MSLSKQILELLLYENESSTLDFKRDQYPFEGATNDDKSELLKDILSFSNAWRRSDAYILIGVEEVQGKRPNVVGITKHLDDAKLQQFVNSKTQRPVHFSYQQARLDNQDIGVIHIPPQERPIYITKNFGNTKKETVYIRRNSSTAIASPDEIVRMRQTVAGSGGVLPLLELQFIDPKDLEHLGDSLEVETVNLSIPEDHEIPDYGMMRFPLGLGVSHTMPGIGKNRHYYRDVAYYLKKSMETFRADFLVLNAGSVLAEGVRVEILIEDPNGNLILRDASEIPDEPSAGMVLPRIPQPAFNMDVNVQRTRKGWIVTADFGKIQPKASAYTSCGLYIGAKIATVLKIAAKLFADNLPSPRECELTIKLRPTTDSLSVERLIELTEKKPPNNVIETDE